MPELPEVETVRRGLAPVLTGAAITDVELRRPDLRFPFPERFAERLRGQLIAKVDRRAKFLVMPLSSGEVWTAHLGMTGRFRVEGLGQALEPGAFYAPDPPAGHDHLIISLETEAGGRARLIYSDPRRFGFVELFEEGTFGTSPRLADLGPEPLDDAFDGAALRDAVRGKTAPLKAVLLDQKIVAGLGNIYVCEALFLARLSPRRQAKTLGAARSERLVAAVKAVLRDAIRAGGSTLRDYAAVDGQQGSFQQAFRVYDRAGQPCGVCGQPIKRIVQSGRSTFYCSSCQR
ncbi:MAG: bifunctional DNA-formamidopyrimidine glycosylase/DNA-(apurinic or apyrimidinic site) lyase [Pseudomonadota bacterium]